MQLQKYELKTHEVNKIFDFISTGRNGEVHKRIVFVEEDLDKLYSLEFGDAKTESSEIDYLATSDNGDTIMILATVAEAVKIFLDAYPLCWIYARGSTPSRTRLYQMNINRFISEISTEFEVYGLRNGEWKSFSTGFAYEAFLVGKKINMFDHKT